MQACCLAGRGCNFSGSHMSLSLPVRRLAIMFAWGVIWMAVLGGASWRWTQMWLDQPGTHTTQIIADLPKGTSLDGIAVRLQAAGVIERAALFRTAAILSGQARRLKAGEYAFPPGASMRQVLAKIASGDILLHRISIAEGLSTLEVLVQITKAEALRGELAAIPVEGSLLPETYLFPRGESRAALVGRMQGAQTALLDRIWKQRSENNPLKSPQEAVILASIVEKETGIASERPLIAGVFFNRLRIGMALQSDPTVVYARDQGAPNSKPLSRKDLAIDSPYNTYKYPGLPPAPIANPGKAALMSVLHPQTTEALYFVSDGSGGHTFSSSLEEHNKNVAKLRAREQRQKLETQKENKSPDE